MKIIDGTLAYNQKRYEQEVSRVDADIQYRSEPT